VSLTASFHADASQDACVAALGFPAMRVSLKCKSGFRLDAACQWLKQIMHTPIEPRTQRRAKGQTRGVQACHAHVSQQCR